MAYRHRATQLSFQSFNNGLGVPLSSDNEWVQLADMLPWQQLDEAYQLLFTEMGGRAAKPFRLLYGASLIKQAEHLTDRSVVTAIRDTPAYQYFIGLDTYTTDLPFNHSTLVYFRRRMGQITELVRNIISDTLREQIQSLLPDDELRVLITDATAVPIEIRFPQDTSLLNQARLNLEEMLLDM
ncbi:transposase, partial [Lacticaseibacillus rhamnosus]